MADRAAIDRFPDEYLRAPEADWLGSHDHAHREPVKTGRDLMAEHLIDLTAAELLVVIMTGVILGGIVAYGIVNAVRELGRYFMPRKLRRAMDWRRRQSEAALVERWQRETAQAERCAERRDPLADPIPPNRSGGRRE